MDERPKIRICGFERPLHPLQIVSYAVFGIDVCIYVVFVLALVHDISAIIGVALCYTATVIALVIATVKATACNPMDPHIGTSQGESTPTIIDTPDFDSGSLAFCTICSVHVYARSKHCRECSKCVNIFDHHCMWLNNCVGNANYHAFFATILSVAAMIGIVLVTCLYLLVDYIVDKDMFEQRFRDIAIFRKFPKEFFMGLLVTMIAVNVPLFLLDMQLIFLHCFLASQRLTTYEYITIKLEHSPPEDGGEKYKSDEKQRTIVDKNGRKITTLPRCLDWIVFCRCGRRRRRRTKRNDVERIDTLQVEAVEAAEKAESASENSATGSVCDGGLVDTCPAPPGSTDNDGEYDEDNVPFRVKDSRDIAVASKPRLCCPFDESDVDAPPVCEEVPYEALHGVAAVPSLY